MTVDFEFYRRMYSGVRIPADEFLKYSIKSENLLKSMTKKEAWEYLNTVPIDFSDYTVNYRINGINTEC